MQFLFDPAAHPRITVDDQTGCWHGSGGEVKGHTRLPIGGRQAFGHVVMYVVFRGIIPKGRVLHHTCETPDCWNPWHVEPVTGRQHAAAHAAQRSSCPNGHAYPEHSYRDAGGSLRCRICTAENRREAKRRAKAARCWRCVECGASGDGTAFPLVGPTTRACASCGAKGGHKVKRDVAPAGV